MSCVPPPPSLISASQTMTAPLSITPISVISVRSYKIQLRLKNPNSKPYPNRFRISTTNVTLSSVTPLPPISAQFSGERKSVSRRNYLREKILQKQQQMGSGNFIDSSENRFAVIESVNGGDVVSGATGFLPEEERLKLLGESEMLSKLESWADQYNKDVELWGVGSSPIFTVFKDLGGNVERVLVNEDEIRARSGLEEDLKEVNLRILHARLLAKDLESGKKAIPRNSTVAKFVLLSEAGGVKGVKIVGEISDKILEVKELDDVKDDVKSMASQFVESSEEFDFLNAVRTAVLQPGLYPKLSKFGIVALSGFLVLWAVKSVIAACQRGKLTTLVKRENEGKVKPDEDEMVKVRVEVLDDSSRAQKVRIRRPKLDKQELLKKMSKNKAPTDGNFQLQQSSSSEGTETRKLEENILDAKDIATHNRESEEKSSSLLDDSENLYVVNPKVVDVHVREAATLLDFQDETSQKAEADSDGESTILEESEGNTINFVGYDATETESPSIDVVQTDSETMTGDDFCAKKPDEVLAFVQGKESCVVESLEWVGAYHSTSLSSEVTHIPEQSAPRKKLRIIKSVKEARDYLSRTRDKQEALHIRADIFTEEGVSSSWLQSETPNTGININKAANSQIDLAQNNSNLPVGACSTMKMGDSQLNKKTVLNVDNDIGENESSAMSRMHGRRLLTDIENQQPHQNDEVVFNDGKLVSWPQTGADDHCSITGNVENNTDFSQDNIDAILGSSGYIEQVDESLRNGNPSSNNDLVKIQQPVVLPINNDPEGTFITEFAIKEPPKVDENIFSPGVTISDVKYEDDRHDSANVLHDGKPTQISDVNCTQKKKENKPVKDINLKHAAAPELDTPVENIATSETVQAPKHNSVTEPRGHNDYWLEKNFHVLNPVVAKIRDGFRENYMVAQEKTEEAGTIFDLSQLESVEDDHELEWMKDDHLRDIVFKVRDNELSGREPFHLMSKEDEAAFFGGLQKKVEQENKKMLKVHEYIHSNVENLNYGADGISIYDPAEKVIPRWKGPPIEKASEFLSKPIGKKDTVVKQNVKSPPSEKSRATSPLKTENGASRKPKIIIEGSDGSVKAGKKNGKEFWQHTKKWSRGFLELYNAETDPEVKASMKDMGKDLDRWITEEEIQEAAEWIEKMPERNKEFIQKKVEKIKREMELFGPQAVVTKYREYSEEKEEDYLWWLDLPYVLCIEMYTDEGGEQRVGFYSLDMATDLKLEPKPCHVIAFEDSKDCKNMCYIIQSHLEMLGSGLAFVIARPPKDTFRESKANGFNVTVIRKGELSLNIDQMLEEVEERIFEIGSKMYHDQIMKDRGVDMNALMKGVIGDTKPVRRKQGRRKQKNIITNKQ